MRTCAAWGVQTTRTDDPGVWIKKSLIQNGLEHHVGNDQTQVNEAPSQSDRKICAIGVQVSRGITSHGIGLNVFDAAFPPPPAKVYDFTPAQKESVSYAADTGGYLSWGFSRIVACGLEGKGVTWLAREGERGPKDEIPLESVAEVLAQEVSRGLNVMKRDGKESVDGVYRVQEADILSPPDA